MSPDDWARLRSQAVRLLRARSHPKAADVLSKVEFDLSNGTNYFNDEFSVLHVTVDVERYTRFGELKANPEYVAPFEQIAETISEIGPYVRFIVARLEQGSTPAPVEAPSLLISSASVERALEDSALLIRSSNSGPSSAVDRAHTALHGYLRAACSRENIPVEESDTLAKLFKRLRTQHPALAQTEPRPDDMRRVLGSIATILDALGPVRNQASNAHPNETILGEAEAMLVINSARTLLHYLDAKLT